MAGLNFKNVKGMQTTWGVSRPPVLQHLFEYLHSEGYVGPLVWSSPQVLELAKKNSSEVSTSLAIVRQGQRDVDEYAFDVSIMLRSTQIGAVAKDIGLESESVPLDAMAESFGQAILVVSLSHLKWVCNEGTRPLWLLHNDLDRAEFDFEEVRKDWLAYGKSFVADLLSLSDLADRLGDTVAGTELPAWVRSNGPNHALINEYHIIALLILGRLREADAALSKYLDWCHKARGSTHFLQAAKQRVQSLQQYAVRLRN